MAGHYIIHAVTEYSVLQECTQIKKVQEKITIYILHFRIELIIWFCHLISLNLLYI